jgi:hypothetical protein
LIGEATGGLPVEQTLPQMTESFLGVAFRDPSRSAAG